MNGKRYDILLFHLVNGAVYCESDDLKDTISKFE